MAEGGGLLNRYTLQRRIEGSNPSGSARFQLPSSESPLGRCPEINPVCRSGTPTEADVVVLTSVAVVPKIRFFLPLPRAVAAGENSISH